MGLVNKTGEGAGAFEGMDDDGLGEPTASVKNETVLEGVVEQGKSAKLSAAKEVSAETTEAAAAVEEAPAAATTTAVAAPAAGNAALVPISALKLDTQLANLENFFEKSGLSVEFGTFPRVKIEGGVICTEGDQEAGSFFDLEVMSFTSSFIITPNDDAAPTTLARYSNDGVTINSADEWNGRPCTEYVEHLRDTEKFQDAGIREYLNLYGAVINSDKPFLLDEIVCVQCSPQARQRWTRHLINHGRRVSVGKAASEGRNVRISVEKGKSGTRTYYFFTFSPVPQA